MKFQNLLFKLSLAVMPAAGAAIAAEPVRQAVTTPDAPAAKGPYSQAIRYGVLLFLAANGTTMANVLSTTVYLKDFNDFQKIR